MYERKRVQGEVCIHMEMVKSLSMLLVNCFTFLVETLGGICEEQVIDHSLFIGQPNLAQRHTRFFLTF